LRRGLGREDDWQTKKKKTPGGGKSRTFSQVLQKERITLPGKKTKKENWKREGTGAKTQKRAGDSALLEEKDYEGRSKFGRERNRMCREKGKKKQASDKSWEGKKQVRPPVRNGCPLRERKSVLKPKKEGEHIGPKR